MRRSSFAYRLCTATALAGMLIGSVGPALAQGAPGPELSAPRAASPIQAAGDPPARVGRVARVGGTVSFHTADATQWEPAQLNAPVTSGNWFWTQPGASTDLDVGGTRVVLDQTTELAVDQLNDENFTATASQGRIYLQVRNIQMNENTTIRTPRGTVVITAPGRYEIAVGDTETPTLLTVDQGAATIEGPGVSLSVGDHQTAQVSGTDNNFNGILISEQRDNFLDGQVEREHPPRAIASIPPPPPVVQQMTGYEAVADTGEWDTHPEYGQVWYPPVQAGWVPYREGHWAFVAPWGWTWVDDAPWGFAPFHYGRWVEIGPRWGWIPVERGEYYQARPVYAPALVAFVGVGVGVAVGFGIGAAMGWIPLGPREAYHPPYRASPGYFNRVNVTNVTNISNVRNLSVTNVNYVNARGAASVAPGSAFQNSQNLRGVARSVPAGQVGALQPLFRPSVTPTASTQGVTPGVARSLNLPPSAPGSVATRSAPGPAFQPRANANVIAPGGVAAPNGLATSPTQPRPSGFATTPQPGRIAPASPPPASLPPTSVQPTSALPNAVGGAAPHGLPPIAVHGAPPAPTRPVGPGPGGSGVGPSVGPAGGAAPVQANVAPQQHFAPPQAPVQRPTPPEPRTQATAPIQPQQQFHAQPVQPPAQPQAQPQFHQQPQPQLQPPPQVRQQPAPQPQPQFHAQPQPQPAPQPQFHPQPAPQPQVHVQPQPQFHPQPAPPPAPRPQPAPPPQHPPQQHSAQRPEPHRG